MRFRELFLQFVLDFQLCAEREGSGANAVQTRMGAQQFSGGALQMGQRLFDHPSFADQAVDTPIVSLRWVHRVPLSLLRPSSDKRLATPIVALLFWVHRHKKGLRVVWTRSPF